MNPRKLLLPVLLFVGTVCCAQSELTTTRIDKVYEQSGVRCIYTFDFPTGGESPLYMTVLSLMQFGYDDEYNQYNWQIKDLESLEEAIKTDAESVLSNVGEIIEPWTRIVEVSKISEGNKYVCYKNYYYESGASMYPFTQTFVIRKSDGKIIDVLKNAGSKGFCKCLSKKFNMYLYENYEQNNRAYLAECVKERPEIVGFDSEEMDFCWIDDNYLYLGYSQTSLAHVIGIESLRVPLRDAKPYLTNEIKALIR